MSYGDIFEEHDAGDDLRAALTWPEVKASPLAPASIARSLNRLRDPSGKGAIL